jgi:hypothetical protein
MRRGCAKYVLYLVLVFQLALGTAVTNPVPAMARGMTDQSAPSCPQHAAQQRQARFEQHEHQGSLEQNLQHRQSPSVKHDCCHLSGCLHHCTPTAGPTVGLLAWTPIFTATYLLPPSEQPVSLTQRDEPFRPPIA